MYSLEQLRIFVTVCNTGSFSAAARQLKRAQSGVSQSIANFEISINQILFDRSLNKPTLTVEGEALLPIAESILQQTLNFEQKITSFTQHHEHALVIAIEESLIEDTLLATLTPLSDHFPNTNIEIISASTFDVESMVETGKAQIGIIYSDGTIKSSMDSFTLSYNRFVCVTSPQHPLASLHAVKEFDLRQHRQIVSRSATGQELWFSYAISTQRWYANHHQMLISLAQQGIGWAMVPARLVGKAVEGGQVVVLNLEFEPMGWINTIDCITSRSHAHGPAFNAALLKIKHHMTQVSVV